jgi:hypothetical protein
MFQIWLARQLSANRSGNYEPYIRDERRGLMVVGTELDVLMLPNHLRCLPKISQRLSYQLS